MTGQFTRRSVLQSAGAAAGVGLVTGSASGSAAPGAYVVGTASAAADRAAKSKAEQVQRTLDFGAIGRAVAGQFSQRAVEELGRRPDVRYVEPDGRVEQLAETLPWGVDRVDAELAHADGVTGSGADIAIIDTGIDSDHPDLQANLGAGYAVEACDTCDEPWGDDDGHGTHCAGIADAVDNTEGVVGVSSEATLHSVKVIGSDGYASVSGLAAGIEWTADQGYDVGSMSLGASSSYYTLRDACQYAYDRGVFLVAAAGNDGCSGCVRYPAAYDSVVAVSATTSSDGLAYFSSYGDEVELAAPGYYIYSTVPGGYGNKSGTSMACPHVAGAAGLVMANGYSNTEARQLLRDTAEDIGLSSDQQGYGLVDAEAAAAAAAGDGGSDSGDTAVAVTTDGTTNRTVDGATLQGTLSDLGGASSVDCTFEYRADGTSTWTATATQTLSATGGFDTAVDGLSEDASYEFRAVADASDGDTDTGSTRTFTTTNDPVAVATGSASDLTETSATLAGDLTDLGGASSADCAFAYRQQGTSTWSSTSVETRSSTGTFSQSVTGLASGTDYEFRAVADASDGDSDAGTTATFSTAGGTTDTAPTIDQYRVTEAGSPNPHAEISADWSVSDADGDLDSVLVEVFDSGGSRVDAARTSVTGSSASGTDSFKFKHVGSVTFDVRLTVTDGTGNSTSRTTSVSS